MEKIFSVEVKPTGCLRMISHQKENKLKPMVHFLKKYPHLCWQPIWLNEYANNLLNDNISFSESGLNKCRGDIYKIIW